MKTLHLILIACLILPTFAARDCTNTQYISGAFTALDGATKATMACWIRRPSAGSTQQLGPSNLTASFKFLFDHWSDNTMYWEVGNGSNTYATTSANVTGWNHFCMVYDGTQATNATRLVCYINGSLASLGFSGTIPTSLPASGQTMYVNRSNWAIGVGGYAECGLWNEPLTAAEVASLAKGFSPDQIRPSKLVLYMPMVNEFTDLKGTAMTNTSTTVANHPTTRQ